MKLVGKLDHEVLHKLGAISVSSTKDETITDVDVDMSQYDTVKAQVEAERLKQSIKNKLTLSDTKMVRISEDLIDLLISKNLIKLAELPQSVIDKIKERKSLRGQL